MESGGDPKGEPVKGLGSTGPFPASVPGGSGPGGARVKSLASSDVPFT